MGKWANKTTELIQLITPDGKTFDLNSESNKGNWVLDITGEGMPDIDYISQQGPYQHGVSVRDYRLKSRSVQMLLRQQACNRDDFWDRRTELINSLRPNRDPITIGGTWISRSQDGLEDQDYILSLCEFNNRIYGGTGLNGLLFQWDGSGQWVKVADQLNAQNRIQSLVVYDDGGGTDELYGGTGITGRLFKWNGTDAWVQVCAALATIIYDMVVFDDGLGAGDQIFAGTSPLGRLLNYNVGGGAWAIAAPQLGGETIIYSLCVYDDGGGDDLYGGTAGSGLLYRYNPAGGAWVQVCAQLNGQTQIYDLVVFNGQLYGCTGAGGRLFRYDVAGGAWEQVAAQYEDETIIRALTVYRGELYGHSENTNNLLLKWNGTDAWVLAANPYKPDYPGSALLVYDNRLFAGIAADAKLLEYTRRASDLNLPCTVLRRYLSDNSIRDLCVHVDSGPEFKGTSRGWDEHSFQELIRLYAPNPILYDPTEQDGPTYTMDPTATGVVNETQTLSYSGTWREYPVFTITGPITDPMISNEDTDEYIELDYDVAAGTVITIDLTPGNKTIVDDAGINLIEYVTPESNFDTFHLAPDPEVEDGDNDITIQGTGTNANTDFSFTYYNRYIGI